MICKKVSLEAVPTNSWGDDGWGGLFQRQLPATGNASSV